MRAVFWLSVIAVGYSYFGYPFLVYGISRFYRRNHNFSEEDSGFPTVSLIIAAYNEARVIEVKILNSLALDYPHEKLEIIVVSDGASDDTPKIVRHYAGEGVISLHQPERQGKTAALNRGVSLSRGEILVFSDANTHYNREAIRKLVRHFADPVVGGVCGRKDIFPEEDRQSSVGDSFYWKYESFLKELESSIGSITGADGEIFSMRRSLYKAIDESVINDDAEITFGIVGAGYRVLYDTEAISQESASITLKDDFYVKVRMVAGGFQTVSRHWHFLLFSFQPFALQFISHKVVRWLVPMFLIVAFITNVFLADLPAYGFLFISQCVFYAGAAVGYWRIRLGRKAAMLYIPLYFTVMNLAALVGLCRFLAGQQSTSWRKAQR